MATSHGDFIDRVIRDYTHGPEMRDRVAGAVHEADAAVHAHLVPFQRTGTLFRDSHAELREYDGGWGMEISSLWRSFFVANERGRTLNRHSEFAKGRRKGNSAYRRSLRSAHYADHKLSRHAASPSVFGTAIGTFGDSIGVWG